MNVEISIGEFVDKISILKIKKERITDQGKLNNVLKEYEYLIQLLLREKQRSEQYDSDFIDIANRIHSTNDIRAQIKKEINLKFNSNFVEEKSHQK